MLSLKDIEAADDRGTADVEVPEWGGTVKIRALTMKQTTDWVKAVDDGENQILGLAARSLVDDKGALLFPGGDTKVLAEKNPVALKRIHAAALVLNGFDTTALDDAKKNSTPSDGSSTD